MIPVESRTSNPIPNPPRADRTSLGGVAAFMPRSECEDRASLSGSFLRGATDPRSGGQG